MSDWQSEDACPVCKTENTVPPYGNKQSKILLIGEFPGEDEVKKGIPFVGATGQLLRQELAYIGIDLQSLRRGNLWFHAPNKNNDCLKHGVEVIIKEAIGKKLILLIGSDAVKFFTGEKISEVNGLVVPSDYFSGVVMACIQPASIFQPKGTIGELRFALNNFNNKIEEMKLL